MENRKPGIWNRTTGDRLWTGFLFPVCGFRSSIFPGRRTRLILNVENPRSLWFESHLLRIAPGGVRIRRGAPGADRA